tara:strand:- start:324 stop:572 length:249 start_codon:yes stop_codon:yes gene_type:complete
MTLETDRRRGDLARQILENEIFQNAFEDLEQAIFDEWKVSDDVDVRESLWLMLQIVPRFQSVFISAVSNGAVASKELQRFMN